MILINKLKKKKIYFLFPEKKKRQEKYGLYCRPWDFKEE